MQALKHCKNRLKQGLTEAEIKASWKNDLEVYKKLRSKYLLYK